MTTRLKNRMTAIMLTMNDLFLIADAFRALSGIERESTLSHRIFGEAKKLSLLRSGGDLTLSRFLGALDWFAANWPADAEMPQALMDYVSGSVASVRQPSSLSQ